MHSHRTIPESVGTHRALNPRSRAETKHPAHRCLDCGAVLCENCARECGGPREVNPELLGMRLAHVTRELERRDDVLSERRMAYAGMTHAEQVALSRAMARAIQDVFTAETAPDGRCGNPPDDV